MPMPISNTVAWTKPKGAVRSAHENVKVYIWETNLLADLHVYDDL